MNNRQSGSETQNQYEGKNRGCGPFSRMFSGQFGGRSHWNKFGGPFQGRKAANIEEDEAAFKISLYAAGLIKNNFKISVTDDVLTIAYVVPQGSETNQRQYAFREYEPVSFERSFQLNSKVLTDQISASYTDGVLQVTLPKNPDTNRPSQQVEVN